MSPHRNNLFPTLPHAVACGNSGYRSTDQFTGAAKVLEDEEERERKRGWDVEREESAEVRQDNESPPSKTTPPAQLTPNHTQGNQGHNDDVFVVVVRQCTRLHPHPYPQSHAPITLPNPSPAGCPPTIHFTPKPHPGRDLRNRPRLMITTPSPPRTRVPPRPIPRPFPMSSVLITT